MKLNNSDLHTYAREQARTMHTGSFYITTNGCEEGGLESARVKLFLESHGLRYTNDINNADIIILYACGLTNKSENTSLKNINKLMTLKNPSAELIVWGCLPKINYDAVKNISKDIIIGPRDINFFENLVNTNRRIQAIESNSLFPHVKNRSIFSFISSYQYQLYESAYYIRAARGCMGNCTFCSDRLVHGRDLLHKPLLI